MLENEDGASRALQQVFTEGPEPGTDTVVDSPEQLQAAVQAGDKYIEIIEHLDLRSLDPVGDVLLDVGQNGTISIRGNCAEEPKPSSWNLSGEELVTRSPVQCVLVTDIALLKSTAENFWLHNLFIRHQVSGREGSAAPRLLSVKSPAEGLWMTHVTAQGQGIYEQQNGEGCKFVDAERPVYMEGSYLVNLGGANRLIDTNSSVAVVNSRIQNNSMFSVTEPLLRTAGTAGAASNVTAEGSESEGGTMWLRGSLLSDNDVVVPMFAANDSLGFFSDVPREFFSEMADSLVETTAPPDDVRPFFLARSSWLKSTIESIPGVLVQTAIRDQATFDATVTTVATPLALQEAVQGGARHIRITQHGDLRDLESVEGPKGGLLGPVSSTTYTIQGRCSQPPEGLEVSGAPIRELLSGQCVLVADKALLKQYVGRLWLDNLYIRVQPTSALTGNFRVLEADASGGELWVTRTTIQGDGSVAETTEGDEQGGLMGLYSDSEVYAHGLDITDVGGNSSAAVFGSTALLADCTFANNTFTGGHPLTTHITAPRNSSHVWLQDVTVDATQGPMTPLAEASGGSFYSAVPLPVVQASGVEGAAQGAPPPEDMEFLRASDPWIVAAAAEINQHIVPFEDLPEGSPRSNIVAAGPGVALPKGAVLDAEAPAPDFAAMAESEAALTQDVDTSTENGISIPWWVYVGGAGILALTAVFITVGLIMIQHRKRKRMHELHEQQPALSSSLATSAPPSGQYGESLAAAAAAGSMPILGRPARPSPFAPGVHTHANALAVGSGPVTGTHSHSSSGISSVAYATAAADRFDQVSVLNEVAPRESNGTLVSPMVPGPRGLDEYSYSYNAAMHASHVRSSTQGSGRKGPVEWSLPDYPTNIASPNAAAPWFGTMSSKAGSDHPFNWSEGGTSGVELGSVWAGRDSLNGALGPPSPGGAGWVSGVDPWALGSLPNGSDSVYNSHGRNSVPDGRSSQGVATVGLGLRDTIQSKGSMGALSTTGMPLDGTPALASRGFAADTGYGSLYDRKMLLGHELDYLHGTAELFLGKYVVLSAHDRRDGGQGVVQFMRSALSGEAVAVKFFLSRSVFDQETVMYNNEVLKSMMPTTREVVPNSDGACMSSRGYQWPPCIILEKGESLQEWAQGDEARYSTIMDALNLTTEKLAKLHASGWVHRDLKPGNVLRLPSHHSWTLMDFGCAAEQGAEVPIMCNLAYAPPEVVHLVQDGEQKIVAERSADIWALGVIAFELLTQSRLFDPYLISKEQAMYQLCGFEPLPWEEGAEGAEEKLQMLKGLKTAVLKCLNRDPKARPHASGVQALLSDLFEVSAGLSQFESAAQPAI